jgi:hypothetical protein
MLFTAKPFFAALAGHVPAEPAFFKSALIAATYASNHPNSRRIEPLER